MNNGGDCWIKKYQTGGGSVGAIERVLVRAHNVTQDRADGSKSSSIVADNIKGD